MRAAASEYRYHKINAQLKSSINSDLVLGSLATLRRRNIAVATLCNVAITLTVGIYRQGRVFTTRLKKPNMGRATVLATVISSDAVAAAPDC